MQLRRPCRCWQQPPPTAFFKLIPKIIALPLSSMNMSHLRKKIIRFSTMSKHQSVDFDIEKHLFVYEDRLADNSPLFEREYRLGVGENQRYTTVDQWRGFLEDIVQTRCASLSALRDCEGRRLLAAERHDSAAGTRREIDAGVCCTKASASAKTTRWTNVSL